MKRVIISAAFAVLAGTSANAATMSCTSPNDPSTTYTLDSAGLVDCFAGNDTPTIDGTTEIFGMMGWTLAEKQPGGDGDGAITFSDTPTEGATSGTWAITGATAGNSIMVTLKAAESWAGFLVDSLSGTWEINRGLSHASIYYTVNNSNPPLVPLPAGAVLLISGLAALGLGRRLKS